MKFFRCRPEKTRPRHHPPAARHKVWEVRRPPARGRSSSSRVPPNRPGLGMFHHQWIRGTIGMGDFFGDIHRENMGKWRLTHVNQWSESGYFQRHPFTERWYGNEFKSVSPGGESWRGWDKSVFSCAFLDHCSRLGHFSREWWGFL